MSKRLLSRPSMIALANCIHGHRHGDDRVGIGIGYHRELHRFFHACDIDVFPDGPIHTKVSATLDRLNEDPSQHNLLRRVLDEVADHRYYNTTSFDRTIAYLNHIIQADGLVVRKVGDLHKCVSTGTNLTAVDALRAKASTFGLDSVRADFDRATAQAESDPEDALTSACSTIESVCKHILDDLNHPYPSKQDIQHLASEVAKHLGLSPARTNLPDHLAQDLRRALGGLESVVAGVGALRTHFGDAHGRGKSPRRVDARIARLAVNAACTLSVFYIETWQRHKTTKKGQ